MDHDGRELTRFRTLDIVEKKHKTVYNKEQIQ